MQSSPKPISVYVQRGGNGLTGHMMIVTEILTLTKMQLLVPELLQFVQP